jgi:hypothetical protein
MLLDISALLRLGYDFSFSYTNAVLCFLLIIVGGILGLQGGKKIFWLISIAGIVWAIYMLKEIG